MQINLFFMLFTCTGISSLSSCGDPDRLPELPPGDEQRLQRAALHLQQKLILREWLKENQLQHHYNRYCVFKYRVNPISCTCML